MNEVQKIFSELQATIDSGSKAAIATLVHIEGSSYRRPGARMIIRYDGTWVGAISGGCLESDVMNHARKVMDSKTPLFLRYDTRNDESNVFGLGMGCNGILEILVEPVRSVNDAAYSSLNQIANSRSTCVHALVYHSDHPEFNPGMHWVLDSVDAHPATMPENVHVDCVQALRGGISFSKQYAVDGKSIDCLIDAIQQPVHLLIFGAGYDAIPIAQIASMLGWRVEVFDKSPLKAQPARFLSAHRVEAMKPESVLNHCTITKQSYCVVMSHNFEYDAAMLGTLIKTDAPYIGMLGPRSRFEKIKAELKRQGVELNDEMHTHIYAPAGVDVGAETPEEIALSVITEIQSLYRGTTVQSLKDKAGAIHAPVC